MKRSLLKLINKLLKCIEANLKIMEINREIQKEQKLVTNLIVHLNLTFKEIL